MTSRRNQPHIVICCFVLILAAFFLPGCERAQDKAQFPKMDRLDLVTDADMIVRCSDTSALFVAIEQSPIGRFWKSPDMRAVRDGQSLEDEIRRFMIQEADSENAAQITDIYMEQAKMIDGEFILGLDFVAFDGEPAVTIVAAMREEDYQRSLEMDELLFELEDVETIKASEDFRGTRIYTYMRKEETGDRFFYQAFQGGTLVASENRTWLERALIRLMETPAREPEGDPVLAITGKAKMLDRLQTMLAEHAAENDSPVDMPTVIKSLGIDTLGDVDLTLCMKEDRLDLAFQVARRGEWNHGLMVLIPAEPAPVDFRMAHVPPDVASYQVTRLDLNALWTQIPEILRQISPEFQMQFSMGLNAVGGMMDINVNEDIFNNLDRLAFSYARLGDNGQELVYGLKIKDAAAMERTLRKLFAENSPVVAQLGQFYRETDIQGHIVHVLQFPDPSGNDDAMAFNEIGLTVVDRALVIGQGDLLVAYVQAALGNQGVPDFYESVLFKEMAARVPADACSYSLSDLSAYARFFMGEVRKTIETVEVASADEDFDAAVAPLADILKGFDVAQLPSDEVIAGYFGNSDGYSVIDATGFKSIVTVYYPAP
ncbi:MAG: hypothetical protein HF981_13330 [Desulfobacteraceae bacterium]|nr:hypothetical protein [Desulfobacteraceae bacterium]MBC2751363.1 hypothetical protein [Desulfobacteraceae bacterium]